MTEAAKRITSCSLCGFDEFVFRKVLWPELINQWQLSPDEAQYIDQQQGTTCARCQANYRGIAFGHAIRDILGISGTIREYASQRTFSKLSILDMNGTSVSVHFSQLDGYVRADYPAVDMHEMPYKTETFDLVLHSDTLEHLRNPIHALMECKRILKVGGHICYTVPTIVGRLSRSRQGLPLSFHGTPETSTEDYAVQTEFGADAWTYVVRAGFSKVTIHAFEFPIATVISACK